MRHLMLVALASAALGACSAPPPPLACDLIDQAKIETIVGKKLESIELINEEKGDERVGSTCELKFQGRPNMRFWVYRYAASTAEIESKLSKARAVALVRGKGYFSDNVIGKDNIIDAYFDERSYVAVGITFYDSISDTKKVLVDAANMVIEGMGG